MGGAEEKKKIILCMLIIRTNPEGCTVSYPKQVVLCWPDRSSGWSVQHRWVCGARHQLLCGSDLWALRKEEGTHANEIPSCSTRPLLILTLVSHPYKFSGVYCTHTTLVEDGRDLSEPLL